MLIGRAVPDWTFDSLTCGYIYGVPGRRAVLIGLDQPDISFGRTGAVGHVRLGLGLVSGWEQRGSSSTHSSPRLPSVTLGPHRLQ